jgi:hypothetical protein
LEVLPLLVVLLELKPLVLMVLPESLLGQEAQRLGPLAGLVSLEGLLGAQG